MQYALKYFSRLQLKMMLNGYLIVCPSGVKDE